MSEEPGSGLVEVVEGAEYDAEVVDVDAAEVGGPVDPPDEPFTLYGTITGWQDAKRQPIVPAWLRNRHQRRQMARVLRGYIAYVLALHAWNSPRYLGKTAWYAPLGVGRLAGRQIKWWWLTEQYGLRQNAATRNDAKTWQDLHKEAKATRLVRGSVLGVELFALVIVVLLLVYVAPWWLQVATAVVAPPVLAHYGRPADKPIVARVSTGPKFVKLTAEMVRNALVALCIQNLKEPSQITFPPPGIHRDGPGWLARFNLPPGVRAVKVLEAREGLSSALRLPIDQIWPEAGPEHAGQVDLWVGYLPASKMGQPTWDLAKPNARTSFFEPAPFSTDARQRPISTTLFETNELVGGAPGSGKSYGARTLATIAMLDPTCEMKIAEFKGTGDFLDMEHLCSTYTVGVLEENFEVGKQIIEWALAECERRGRRVLEAKRRGEAPLGKVTPELAGRPGSGLHPVFILLDEVHELFLWGGKELAEKAERAIKRGRALGIHITLATQIPDKDSVPPNITRCVTIRWCLAVTGQVENDMILGTGAYKRGLSATVYRPRFDAGWGVMTGLERAGSVRSFFPEPDVTKAIVARATQLRGGLVVGADHDLPAARDLLDDVLRVFATFSRPNIHWKTLAELLAEHMPEAYSGITQDAVSQLMRDKGVPSEGVKVDGVNLQGCKRRAVETAVSQRAIGA